MTHTGRRMPLPTKVHTFYAEVCGDQELRSRKYLQYGAIVADTLKDAAATALTNEAADPFDELSFRQQAA